MPLIPEGSRLVAGSRETRHHYGHLRQPVIATVVAVVQVIDFQPTEDNCRYFENAHESKACHFYFLAHLFFSEQTVGRGWGGVSGGGGGGEASVSVSLYDSESRERKI